MLVPLSWLKKYLDFSLSPFEIADILTLAGLEVEKIEEKNIPFIGVVTAEVQKVTPHPNADKLHIAHVFDGKETIQVVCGAHNCREGIKVAFAKIGAELTDEKGKRWKIKSTRIRDVESHGMLCSEKELGLSEEHAGIIELNTKISLGIDLKEHFSDTVLEIALTPNLGHCAYILGIARELAAQLNLRVAYPQFKVKESQEQIEKAVSVSVENFEKCPRYSCRLIKGVNIGPSPSWLKNYLKGCGVRSVNNIVDVTNFVMLEMGQPMHAFDYDKLADHRIVVKEAKKEQPFLTLDGEYTVPRGSLFICDSKNSIAIAGVIGGKKSAVIDSTQNILLESAYFEPISVRKTSKTLNLRTESSSRFEKGIDPNGITKALDRAADLIQQTGGGFILKGIIDQKKGDFKPLTLPCRLNHINNLLGTSFSLGEIESLLKRLEMSVKREGDNIIHVTIPTYRNDVKEEIDLIEEIARIYGYNNIKKATPHFTPSSLPPSSIYLIENRTRERLIAEGLQEFLTSDLISSELAELSIEESMPSNAHIHVLRPSSIDQSILRTSLLPGLLQAIKHNDNYQNGDISAFEIGRIHFKVDDTYKERSMASVILTGKQTPHHFKTKPQNADFFDLKGIIENLFMSFDIPEPHFTPSNLVTFHPHKQAHIICGPLSIGVIGEVHPNHLKKLAIDHRVFFAQIDLHDLEAVKGPIKKMTPLPLYPGSERDWTLTLTDELPIGEIFTLLKTFKSSLLKKVILLDLFQSEKLGKGKKNATFRFFYRHNKKTIEQESVEKEHSRMMDFIMQKLS